MTAAADRHLQDLVDARVLPVMRQMVRAHTEGLPAFLRGLADTAGGLELLDNTHVVVASLEYVMDYADGVAQLFLRARRTGWASVVRYTRGAGTMLQPMECTRTRVRTPVYVLEGAQLQLRLMP